MKSREWRLDNLYTVLNPQGEAVTFVRNWAQKNFYKNIWYFNVILKARQLGFSTFILIYILDACLFNDNHHAGVIAQTRDDAIELFNNKIKYTYDSLDPAIKAMYPAVEDSARKLSFANGSSIQVGTSLRSGTFQKLHVSELGKIAAKYPEKAKEIRTGAFNTVHAGQQIFVESTAEGMGGEFYDLCERAQNLRKMRLELSPLDPKFHFYPWWKCPTYNLAPTLVQLTKEDRQYFRDLEKRNIILTPAQQAWYAKKAETQGDEMKREFPSTPEEAFEAAVEGAYYSKQMGILRRKGRICRVPHDPSLRVNTYWDIGRDTTAIWFGQHKGRDHRFINYYSNSNENIQHYARHISDLIEEEDYVYARHYWPHDGDDKGMWNDDKLRETAKKHGIRPITIVPRTQDLQNDVQAVRDMLPQCTFDKENCGPGIAGLCNYRKEWNEALAVWHDRPRHDAASHPEAAFRSFVLGYKEEKPDDPKGGADADEQDQPDTWEDM